jgi:hypothetical protein
MLRPLSFCSSHIFLSHFDFGLDAKFLTIHDGVRETEREVLRTKQPSNCGVAPNMEKQLKLALIASRRSGCFASNRVILSEGMLSINSCRICFWSGVWKWKSGASILSRLAVLPACYQVALDAKGRYRIGGGQIIPRRSYLDQGGTTPLLRAYAIDCPRCSC